MPHPIDASIKHLVTEYLADWLLLSGRRATGPLEVIDADLSTVTAYADKVLRVVGDPPWLLHLELQGYRDLALPSRVHFYNALLEHRHGAAVWSVVVLLSRTADHAGLTGFFGRGLPGEAPYRTYRYQVVRVWQTPAEVFLSGGLGTLPLAPLSDVAAADLPGVLGRMDERLRRDVPPRTRDELWKLTSILMGARYPTEYILEQLKMAINLGESSFLRDMSAKWLAEGRAEGRAEARTEGARTLILRMGEKRFGAPTDQVKAALDAITDPNRLEELGVRLLDASSWDELLAAP